MSSTRKQELLLSYLRRDIKDMIHKLGTVLQKQNIKRNKQFDPYVILLKTILLTELHQ